MSSLARVHHSYDQGHEEPELGRNDVREPYGEEQPTKPPRDDSTTASSRNSSWCGRRRIIYLVSGLVALVVFVLGVVWLLDLLGIRVRGQGQHENFQGEVTMAEVKARNTPDNCWVVYHGSVYDMTNYAKVHPGGDKIITDLCGEDGTDAYDIFHPVKLLDTVPHTLLGVLIDAPQTGSSGASSGNGGGDGSGGGCSGAACQERRFTLEEVAQHNTADDCFMVLWNVVYDLTDYASDHPGGAKVITDLAGTDATVPYEVFHKEKLLFASAKQYRVGILDTSSPSSGSGSSGGGGNNGGGNSGGNSGGNGGTGDGGSGGSSPATGGCQERQISIDELSQHNNADDLWTAFYGVVYNLTAYAPTHPGKAGPVVNVAGQDGTAAYGLFHPENLLFRQAQNYRVGLLSDVSAPATGCTGGEQPATAVCTQRRITMAEVASKASETWMVIHGKVYDMSLYAPRHPGGARSVTRWAGGDATNAFDDEHTTCLLQYLEGYEMGVLSDTPGEDEIPCPEPASAPISCPEDESSED